MAEGKLFVDTLRKLGYPNCSKLNGSDFDWMFDIPNLQPFLNWFCESLHEENVLSDNELHEYEELVLSSYVMLEGELLGKCLSGLPQDDDVPIEELRKEVALLNSHLKSNEAHLSLLRQQRDIFQVHQIDLNHQVELLEDYDLRMKRHLEYMQQKFIGLQKKVTNCLQSISLHIQDFTNAFKERSENNYANGEMSCASFAHVDLHIYLKTEDQLLYQLKNYIRKHLNKQLVDHLYNGEGDEECELLDLSGNDSSVHSEGSSKIIEQNKSEVSRLHKILKETEMYRVKELTAMAKQQGKVNFLENALHQMNSFNATSVEKPTLEYECKQLEQKTVKKQTELDELLTCALSNVVEKSVQCRSSAVLTGDFESKLAKQEVFLTKQEMILETLLTQHARWKFLTLLLLVEADQHQEAYKLLSELHNTLETTWKKFCSRKEWMTQLQAVKPLKKEINSDDFTACDVMNILGSYSDQKGVLFLTYDDLEQTAKSINEEKINLQSYISSNYAEQMQKLTMLEECFNKWYYLVYGNNNLESSSRPLMGPLDIDAELSKLNIKINTLERNVKDITHEIEKKKKILKEDKYKTEERKIFVYFYTSPENLQKTISSLLREVEGEKNLQTNT